METLRWDPRLQRQNLVMAFNRVPKCGSNTGSTISCRVETQLYAAVHCLAGEKPDKELPGIVGARGDTV